MKYRVPYALAFLFSCPLVVSADEPSSDTTQRYTFSWPLNESAPAPRGGTTRGAAVTLDYADEFAAGRSPELAPARLIQETLQGVRAAPGRNQN